MVLPHHKSCKKRLLTNRKRRERNRQNKGALRSVLKAYRSLPEGSEDRQSRLTDMYSRMDILVRKGIMPRNRANRLKSRLAAFAAK